MTNNLLTANDLRRYLIDDNGWTAHEVRDMLLDGITKTHPRTEDEWEEAIEAYKGRHPEQFA